MENEVEDYGVCSSCGCAYPFDDLIAQGADYLCYHCSDGEEDYYNDYE